MFRRVTKGAAAALLLATVATAGASSAVGEVSLPPPPPPPHEAFVDTATRDLLGRAPTSTERARWVAELDAGRTRANLAAALARRPEHARQVVADLYRRALGRTPDPQGWQFWTQKLSGGTPVNRLAAALYGSSEAYVGAGGTPAAYVEATYQALLGRAAEPAGLAHWSARLADGAPRTALARTLYLSRESNRLRVVLAYIDLLRRPPDFPDLDYWGDRLRTLDDLTFAGRLVASGEYLAWAQRPVGTPGRVASGAWASISGDGRFIAYLPYRGPPRILVLDRLTGRTQVVARGSVISSPIISADGSVVVFASATADIVPGDANRRSDVFVAPVRGGPIRRLTDGDGDSTDPAVSADGRVVAFTSTATDLVPGGTDGTATVYVATRDEAGATTSVERVVGDGPSREPSLSADGTTLVFLSDATDLAVGDDNGQTDAFWARLPLAGADPVRLSTWDGAEFGIISFGGPTVSADGSLVVYLDWPDGEGPGPRVARVEDGTVTERRAPTPPESGFVTRALLSDDGQALFTDVTSNDGRPTAYGLHYRTVDAEPTPGPYGSRVGPYGDMSADGSLLVTGSSRRYPFWGTSVYLYDLG